MNKIVHRVAAAYRLMAVTRKQFDKWPAARKRQYLKDHPYSAFHKPEGADKDEPHQRVGKDGREALFTDRKGTTHAYATSAEIEDHLDELHESQDELAKKWHNAKTDLQRGKIKEQMDHNDDHAKGLAHIAKSKLLKFPKGSTAHEGLDDIDSYLEYNKPKPDIERRATEPNPKRTIKTNRYGNVIGYENGKKVKEFGSRSDAEEKAKSWANREVPDSYKEYLSRTKRDPLPQDLLDKVLPLTNSTNTKLAKSAIMEELAPHYSSYMAENYANALLGIDESKPLAPGSTVDGVRSVSDIVKDLRRNIPDSRSESKSASKPESKK